MNDFRKHDLSLMRGENTVQRPVKAVSTITAQFAALSCTGIYKIISHNLDRLLLEDNLAVHRTAKALIELMAYWGLRVSEALNIDPQDIRPSGQIFVKGLKGSNDRYVSPVQFRQFWIHSQKNKFVDKYGIDRYYLYRVLKNYQILISFKNKHNNSVTHALRYIFVLEQLKAGATISEIKTILGHKNEKSTLIYINTLFNEIKK